MNASTGKPAGNSHDRESLLASLADLAAMIRELPEDAPLPVVSAGWPVPLGPRGERLAYLDDIARLIGAEVADDGMGNLIAERRFGPVRAEGHLRNPDPSVSALRARAAAFRAGNAVTGSGATA